MIICILALTVGVEAQTYSTRKLEEIGADFSKDCLPAGDSIFYCPKILSGKPFVVGYNARHEVEHLGVSLFGSETKELFGLPICRFIERMMLELALQKTTVNALATLKDYRVGLKKNGVEYGRSDFTSIRRLLNAMGDSARFTIVKSRDYTAVWEYGKDSVSLSFPAVRELVFGTDKKEADEALNRLLLVGDGSVVCSSVAAEEVETSDEGLVAGYKKKVFVRKGKFFLSKYLTGDTYFVRSGEKYGLLVSEDYPFESLSNILIYHLDTGGVKLDMTHRMYGFSSPKLEIELKDFMCFFRNDFDFYVAPSDGGDGMLKLIVVLHNTDFNYSHLLLITAPTDAVFRDRGVLQADFYSNVPEQSIKDLFADKM
jgi:hypothetical protein